MLAWWSYVLAISGALNYLLALRGRVEGLYLGLVNQGFWVAYALITHQPGFFFTVGLFVPINTMALVSYYRKKRGGSEPPRRGREYCD